MKEYVDHIQPIQNGCTGRPLSIFGS